ncbi:YggT family protein [Brevundimonas sp. SORGH_AS_0993]|uniref:YggT family protein n=1 Tax=Brevundimonas sp. SORGH_AS_0993 TaxID=3041794 RepID=UPI0027810B0C|nr:YggT family protein [Brevundimonas sp. SORGH_AS_0993]MDQ1154641.1 YggT family protein [Brevundimonas sp. SORGH_AS_0993]
MIVAIINFIFFVLDSLLGLLLLAIIVNAILSWLFAFDVINYRNQAVRQIASFLDAVTGPFLHPLRRIVPNLGGIDITPIIAWIVIAGTRSLLLPAAKFGLLQLIGAY